MDILLQPRPRGETFALVLAERQSPFLLRGFFFRAFFGDAFLRLLLEVSFWGCCPLWPSLSSRWAWAALPIVRV